VNISAIGLNWGDGIILDQEDGKFYGKTVDIAFKMGEDLGNDGEILISPSVYEIIKEEEMMKNFDIKYESDHSDCVGGFDYYHIRGHIDDSQLQSYVQIREHQPPEPSSGVQLFRDRLEPSANIDEVDRVIREKMEKENVVVVMFGADWSDYDEKHGLEYSLGVQKLFLQFLCETFEPFSGKKMTSMIFFFHDPVLALKACMKARELIRERNRLEGVTTFPFTGFGMHKGKILVVEGTELLIGDAINTASKLSDDLRDNESIHVSDDIFQEIMNFDEVKVLNMEKKDTGISGLVLEYYLV